MRSNGFASGDEKRINNDGRNIKFNLNNILEVSPVFVMRKLISVFGSEHGDYSNTIRFEFTEYISESSRPYFYGTPFDSVLDIFGLNYHVLSGFLAWEQKLSPSATNLVDHHLKTAFSRCLLGSLQIKLILAQRNIHVVYNCLSSRLRCSAGPYL